MKLFQCNLLWLLITTFALSAQEQKNILIFGDSITAGYGVDPEQAFVHFTAEDRLSWITF